jgi:dihydropteroate synthase
MKFTTDFKKRAVELKKQGVHPNKIFIDEGIDISDKQKLYAIKLINRWRGWLQKPKLSPENKESVEILESIKKDSESKKVEYLEAKVAYLEAENSFLAKLPKKKR